ncbi:protein FAR1-RELATED SEQUENCE 5-like [Miscanthus floridulus]|uniref:protein FAR1-RELATED SEQUENCE 5-like n=1 Tax=Miscanthus floridulus TaxID=154761 RepID=UPI00345B4855
MQGGYTELMMEQIRNSQEDDQTDWNTQVQHENQDDQPTIEENDLRIIAVEPTSSDITSTVTDDNEHVNGSQELTEEEIEEFIKNEQVAASEGNNAPINSKYTPQLSMEFKSRDDAHHFFNFYAFLAGFQVAITRTTRTQSKKRNNEVVKVTMRCTRQGKEKEPKCLEQEEAEVDKDVGKKPVRRRKTNVLQKSDCPCVMMVKEEGAVWKVKTLDLEHNHELCPGDRDQLFSGHKYMTEMEKGLIKTLNDNNIPTRKMVSILSKKQTEDPSFFYKFDLDEDKRIMENVCAFLHDETVDTFKWVFQTFLQAMGGKHPQTIITDQDMVMKSAIEQVFINTKHRNCLFHIKTKCYNKNVKVFAANEGLYEDFEDIVNNSLTVEEFERLWKRMIEERNLQGNNYFSKMWEMRKMFIPVYYKNDFFPFIQTTSRSEATNARFKDNVGPTYNIISFLKEYNRIVHTINRAERLEDSYSKQKRPKEFIFGYRIEQQAQQLYNRNIFKKFQLQLKATSRLNYRETEDGKTFEVWQKSNQIQEVHRFRRYTVNTELTQGEEEFTCICAKFSKDGILCSHILKIVIEKEISTIPDKYFLDRWRKKDMKDQKNEKAMEYLMVEFDKMEINLDRMLCAQQIGEAQNDQQGNEEGQTIAAQAGDPQTEIDDLERIQRKGRPPKPVRMKIHIEAIKKKLVAAEKKKKKKTNDTNSAGSPVKPKRKKRKETSNGSTDPEATPH